MFFKRRDCDLEAPWIGYSNDYWDDEDEEELDTENTEYDEDFEYESRRDMEWEDEIY